MLECIRLKTLEIFNGGGKVDKGKRIIYYIICIYIYYMPYVRKSSKEVEREKTIRRHISRRKRDELNERARENCERKRL